MKFLRTTLAVVLATGLISCSKQEKPDDGKLLVVTTTTMVTDLTKVIAGDRVEIRGLMGAGIDPHSYVPKLGDTNLLEKADIVFYSGLHLEGRMQATLEAMAKRGRNVIAVSDGVSPDNLLSPQAGFEGTKDPHFWGDPLMWSEAVKPVVDALSKADPAGAEIYQQRGEAYEEELTGLSTWAAEKVAQIPVGRKVLVTSHDAFFYFGRAFGFDVKGLQGVSTAAEAGLQDRSKLVGYLKSQGVPTVFPESSINAKGISAVAAEAGVKVSEESLYSDALGKPGDMETVDGETYDKGTYIGMIKHNVNAIVKGLK